MRTPVDVADDLRLATNVVSTLISGEQTVATAESLTGGLVCAALTSVPGASAVVRGGLVLYATDLKATLGGVDASALRIDGPVAATTAAAMARGARLRLGADVGIATTGVAGPDDQDGHPPGTVHVAAATLVGESTRSFTGADRLLGDREDVRYATVRAALELIVSAVRESPREVGR